MGRWLHCLRPNQLTAGFLAFVVLISVTAEWSFSQDQQPLRPLPEPAPIGLEQRIQDLERQYSALAEENLRLQEHIEDSPPGKTDSRRMIFAPPEPVFSPSPYFAGYADGFTISPSDPDQFPFSFKFNNQAQIRYVGFARDVESWTDSAGIVSPVTNRSAFELTRGRAIFSGYAFDPNLTYQLSIDYTTTGESQINFWNYWISYEFSPAVSLFLGQALVPGTREWLTPALYTQGPDYTMATTFFRPSLSQGIWASGEPWDGVRYRFMVANGFNTLAANPDELDSRMTLAGSVWAEPLGDFGLGFSDFDWHDSPAVRVGASYTISPIEGRQGNPDLPENNDLRLTDGTLLAQTGALAPGVTLNSCVVSLGAFDMAWKYRGLSLNGEFFLRDLFDLRGDGAIPRSSIMDFGGYVQAGCFMLPRKVELYGRTSQISGPYGSGAEYAGGLNWFFLEDRQNLRWTLDVAWLNQSPADQSRTDYRAGDTGLLVRSQIQFFL